MNELREFLKIEREHGGLSPVCDFCDRDLTPVTPVLRVPCSDGSGDHVVCICCLVEVFEEVAQ